MREYARQQTAILLRRLAFQVNRAAACAESDSVHDLRVAIRRLSRCLRVFAAFYPGRAWKKIRRELSGLMRLAGRVRDGDIALALLAEAGAGQRSPIVTRLKADRRSAAEDLVREARRWENSSFSRKWRARLEL